MEVLQNQNDQFDDFGQYVASEMRQLPPQQLQYQLKREIQLAIMKFNDENFAALMDKDNEGYLDQLNRKGGVTFRQV